MLVDWLTRRWRELSPPALFVFSYALLVALGAAGLLLLPGLQAGPRLSLVDALFTATSAACVTGLAVVDTATRFSGWGQLWVLLLIQLGGLGLISMTSAIIGIMGRRLSLRTEIVAAVPSVHERHGRELVGVTLTVMRFTFALEALAAAALWVQWLPDFGPATAAWHAVFHAVSAFCNAGFSTFSGSLMGFADRPGILLTISAAIFAGGFGYLSSVEIVRWWKAGGVRGPARLSTHTWAALVVSLALLGSGAALFALLEWHGVLAHLGAGDKLVNAWFMSATARSAGFNSVPYDLAGNDAVFLTILLMVVGGSPGSTAGGIKTTALAILAAMAWSRMRGRRFVELHGRTVPDGTVQRTVSLTIVFFVLVTAVNLLLSLTETAGQSLSRSREAFLPLMFETASAAATVGLSMGVTPELTTSGKLAIIFSMFMGRIGPLAFFAAMSIKSGAFPAGYRPAHEDVIVG